MEFRHVGAENKPEDYPNDGEEDCDGDQNLTDEIEDAATDTAATAG